MNISVIGTTMPKLKPENEKIILPSNRDNLHHELMRKVRLNRYDLRFMSNIEQKYLLQNKPLSEGQNTLYEKIIHKYRKQLRKLGVPYRDIIELPWANDIITLETLNQKTYFRLADKDEGHIEMQLYFNFNKTQIEDVRSLVHDDDGNHLNKGTPQSFGNGQKYDFNWNNSDKIWYGQFNVYLFKALYNFATKIGVQVDDTAMDFIRRMEATGSKEEWTPSINIVHGRLYVNHIAESMLPILETIDPNDLSIANIERCTKLGLVAPATAEHIAQYVNSASPLIKHEIMDASDVSTLRHYIKDSGRNVIFYTDDHLAWDNQNQSMLDEFKDLEKIEEWGTNVKRFESNTPWAEDEVDKLIAAGYNTLISTTPIANLFLNQDQIGKFALVADKVIYLSIAGKT